MASTAELSKVEQQIMLGKKVIVSGLIANAYGLDGIGSHSSAIINLITRRELSDLEKSTLSHPGSSFLVNQYTMDWRQGRTGYITSSGPHEACPFSDMHLRVFNETDTAYSAVNGGNNHIDGEINSPILKAATLKLASMLALLQQLTYDARALGLKIKPDYKPSPLEKWEPEWERTIGKPLPDLIDLYKNAHLTLVTVQSAAKPHIEHLLFTPTLPYLSRPVTLK